MKKVLGFASGLGGNFKNSGDSPVYFLERHFLQNTELLYPKSFSNPYQTIAELCSRLSEQTFDCVKNQQFFNVIGGDHSSAIGTWSGTRAALAAEDELGLIWIDAHFDSHRPETSLSGNIHGMPASTLLGYGDARLTQIQNTSAKIKGENLCFIGIRSYEPAELNLIEKLNIRCYYMEEIQQRGLDIVFQEARALVTKNTKKYGISLDLDSIDPTEAPGVNTPEKKGIRAKDLFAVLQKYASKDKAKKRLLGFEIAEFNHHRDIANKTENIILQLMDIL